MIELAHDDGLGVDLTLSGGAPRWAEGPGIPPSALDNQFWAWRPSASAFGQFVRAAGERYSGTYVPPGATAPLPRVNFWAVWNEPNFGEDLGPQAIDGSTVSVAPGMYRSLAGQMWNGAAGDRTRPRHGPDRRVRADGPERPRGARASPGPSGQLQPDQAAPVPAHAVLRRLELSGATRTRGAVRRVPDDGRRLAQLPPAEPGAVQRHRRRRPPVCVRRLGPEYRDLDRPRHRDVPAHPRPRACARPAPARVRVEQAVPDLQHRIRLHHPSPEPLLVSVAGDRRVLHQLGRVPELEAAARRHHDAVPAVRPDADRRHVQWRRRLRERARDRQRQAQAGVRRLPPAAVHAGHLDAARPLARGVGMRAAGAVRDPRWRTVADGADSVRTGVVGSGVVRSGSVHDDSDGDDLEREQLLLRRADEVPGERHGSRWPTRTRTIRCCCSRRRSAARPCTAGRWRSRS